MADQSSFTSPGGFAFGVQGWAWGEPKPTTITFFVDGTTRVCDQHGRPIRGAVLNETGKEVLFSGPHAAVIDALTREGVDWRKLSVAGWPQLSYEQHRASPPPPACLEALGALMRLPDEDFRAKVTSADIRKAMRRLWHEADEARRKERETPDD